MAKDTVGAAKPAPVQAAQAEIGSELLCQNYEGTDAPVVGKVIGRDEKWVRLRIEELGREWLVRPDRIDLARGSWEHVAADYPRLGEKPEFDAEFRPAPVTKIDPAQTKAISDAAAALGKLLPEAMRKQVEAFAQGATDRLIGGPEGTVLARWMGKGTLDAAFLDRKSRAVVRPAPEGTEGWFSQGDVKKFADRFQLL